VKFNLLKKGTATTLIPNGKEPKWLNNVKEKILK